MSVFRVEVNQDLRNKDEHNEYTITFTYSYAKLVFVELTKDQLHMVRDAIDACLVGLDKTLNSNTQSLPGDDRDA